MTALVFRSVAAAWTAYTILLFAFAIEIGTGSRAGTGDVVKDRGTKYILVALIALVVMLAVGVTYRFPLTQLPGNQWIVFAVGCVVALGGVALRRWAIAVLGRHFTRDIMIRPDHQVIAAGPYRVLRHPAYSGTLFMALGFGIVLGSWLSIAIMFGGVFAAHIPRILHEEAVLEADLGSRYRAFEHGRKRLIPFVW